MREMCENYFRMFIPEYSLTSKILRNIANIEYARAVVDNTTILQTWEQQLKKQTLIKKVQDSLKLESITIEEEIIKKGIEKLIESPAQEIDNLVATDKLLNEMTKTRDMDEVDLKFVHKTLTNSLIPRTKQGIYRSSKVENKVDPEEILAHIVEFFDWYNSLEAQEEHPIIVAAITKAHLEFIQPFENYNIWLTNTLSYLILKNTGFDFKGYLCFEGYFLNTKRDYDKQINTLQDLTGWLEYFSEGIALESSKIRERVKLLQKDTKVVTVTGGAKLSPRQQRIIEYLQDYGTLQNKDFTKLFPDISEDSVLRDIKTLISKGMIQKAGSTKSSRYEIK